MNNNSNYSNVTDFVDNDNNWTSAEYDNTNRDNAALDLHWGTEMTYDYFIQKHSFNSLNGQGILIRAYANWGNLNAQWDSSEEVIRFGNGNTTNFDALTSLDVIAHEYGHGIDHFSSQLEYINESGALDEGIADVWGSMVELFAAPEKDTYLIGEDIMLSQAALRSMSNPKTFGNPDTYQGDNWQTGSGDFGGVHTNSGVLGHWFYLLAQGSSTTDGINDNNDSFSFNGIGTNKAADILFHAQQNYFTDPLMGYVDARQLTIQAAEDLYGIGSIEASTTCQSWFAVGVGNNSCNVDIELTGNSTICNISNYTYTLNYTPSNSNTNWSVTSGIQIINSNNSSITIKSINDSFNGMATITASISGTVIKKDIWVGKPRISLVTIPVGINYLHVDMVGYNNSDINKQGITSTTWEKISSSGGCFSNFYGLSDRFRGRGDGNCNSWIVNTKITATNLCGTTTIYRSFTPPAPDPCNNIAFNGQNIVIENPCNSFNGIAGNNSSIKNILIYNLMGKKVSNNNDLSILSRGIYIIKVELTTGEILTKKIIK